VLIAPEPLFAKALEEIEGLAAEDRPFFYFLHTYAIHSPYLPPEPYRSQFVSPDYAGGIVSDPEALGGDALRYGEIHRAFWSRVDRSSAADRRHLLDLYDAGIRHVDDALGHLWDGLARLDAAERPIVVVLSDHGEQFGEHGGFEHHALWQEVLHVPLVIHVPSAVRTGWAGRRVETPVGLVDVLPTLLELLGLPVPSHVQGDSLVPLVEAGSPFRPWLFAQPQYTGDAALRAGPWKLLRTGDEEQIFDLARDPGERRARPGTPDLRLRVGEQLDRVLAASRAYHAFADEGAAVELDAGARERLEALGYVDPAAP